MLTYIIHSVTMSISTVTTKMVIKMFNKINDNQFTFTNKNTAEKYIFTLTDDLAITKCHNDFLKIEGDIKNSEDEWEFISEGITPADFQHNIFGNYNGDASFAPYIKEKTKTN